MSENGLTPDGYFDAAITVEQQEAAATDAHAVHKRIVANVCDMRRLWVLLAGDLYDFHERGLWRNLGLRSFEEWLASPEIELGRSWVYELIAMHRQLVVERGVEPRQLEMLDVSKVNEVLPAIRRGATTIEQALADAEALSFRDLREHYRTASVRAPADPEPPLDATTEPEYATCPACGGTYRVRRP